ncbi:hypothetical protein FE257_005221 [Aspergillus nanangensis]|uniref:Uncharacterized protein n=1 Tax=Aspergillus nanangensis TaxID=2582783 RepID=A0AAD4CQR7_ASPNN|nr:hypothetical protein FE257_005221 [Aspergillus nanangensis]
MSTSSLPSHQLPTTPCNHTIPPDQYHTCPHPHHDGYSQTNLPPLLFRLEPLPRENLPVISTLVENGRTVKDYDGVELRDFPFLPRYITSKPSGWLLEFWMRTDHRLTYRDIKARMVSPHHERPMENALNMRRERDVRNPLGLSCWTPRRGNHGRISRIDVERVERWSLDQITYNTTMDIEYRPDPADAHRMVPFRLRAKPLATAPQPTYYPLDTFLDLPRPHVPSRRLMASLDTFHRLAERAVQLDLRHWRLLPDRDLPISWITHRDNARAASGAANNMG